VAGSVQLSCDGQIVRVHPIRHDRRKSMARSPPRTAGPATTSMRRPAGVKATPLRGRPAEP
jgi:hypothetical protein